MRSNYFAKLLKYVKKVYNIERRITKLSEGRVCPKYRLLLKGLYLLKYRADLVFNTS